MSQFDDLRLALSDWMQRNRAYHDASTQFANRFARGFQEYIGAPVTYTDPARKKRPYVEAQILTDENTLVAPDHPFNVLTKEEDGRYRFGVKLVLDHKENSFPKYAFGFSVHFRLKAETCDIRVAEKDFTFNVNDDGARNPAYAFMVELLKTGFSKEPDTVVSKKQIGFIQLREE